MTDLWGDLSEEREIPLEYKALYAESAPQDGKVAVAKVNAILQRAALPPDVAAVILDGAARGQSTVEESDFYTALAMISVVQSLGDPQQAILTVQQGPPDAYGPIMLSGEGTTPEPPVEAFAVDTSPQFRVSIVSKLQGSFLFRHVVYAVEGLYDSRQCRAIRRYSDFVILMEALVKKYPFRLLPPLPPKKLTVDGHYFTKDDSFLEYRRSGLARFINLLLRHPVVGKDELVKAFLVVDAPLSVAMNAPLNHSQDEFTSRTISPMFIANWDAAAQAERWHAIKQGTDDCLEECTRLMQTYYKLVRLRLAASEECDIAKERFTALAYTLPSAFPENESTNNGHVSGPPGDVPAITAGIEAAAFFLDKYARLGHDVAQSTAEGPLEQIKVFRDMLISVREMFARHARLGGNTIAAQQRKIVATQAKVVSRATAPDSTPEDLQKLKDRISAAQESIKQQTNRDWLIKETITRELEMARSLQYQVVQILSSFAILASGRSEAVVNLIQTFTNSISDMPKTVE